MNQEKKMKNNNPLENNTRVLAFDSQYRLSAIFRSISEASTLCGALRQSIIKAVYGDIISVKGRYWRAVPKDIEIEHDDIGSLSLLDFDEMCGEDRRIYATRDMRKGSAILESEFLNKK